MDFLDRRIPRIAVGGLHLNAELGGFVQDNRRSAGTPCVSGVEQGDFLDVIMLGHFKEVAFIFGARSHVAVVVGEFGGGAQACGVGADGHHRSLEFFGLLGDEDGGAATIHAGKGDDILLQE